MQCIDCSTTNPASARYCGECGSPLPSVQPRPDQGQRRLLTVLFCDLVGFTELSSRTDPEELAEILARFQEICARAVGKHDGHIAQLLGDGVLVYFGFPRAHEDDPQRALDCGLAILAQAAESRRLLDHRLPPIRIGVHTGRAFISAQRAGPHREVLAMGDPPNVAARVTKEAEPDTLWVSDATWRLVDGWFEGSDEGTRRLRGLAGGMRLWRVTQRTRATSRLDALRVHAPYVGRRAELGEIHRLWRQVRSRQGTRMLTVIGEPGMGKSRLFEQFLGAADLGDAAAPNAWQLRCVEAMSATAFHPVIERLPLLLGMPGSSDEGSSRALRDLELRCAKLGLHDDDAVILLASLLGLPLPASGASLLAGMSPARRRSRTMETLVALLAALAATGGPLLLVVEDLHWADASTLAWLQACLAELAESPVLILCSARPEFEPPWRGAGGSRELALPRLGVTESQELVRGIARGKSVPLAVMHTLVARCDGVPLYLEEATRSILVSGYLREDEFTWEAEGERLVVDIPSSIEAALVARFDAIGPARATLDLAAAIGREVSVPLLEAVSLDPPEAVAAHLAAMVAFGLLQPVTDESAEPRMRFKHALIRDAAYEAIPRRNRARLHARIVEVLRSRFPHWAETQPELFALHLSGSGDYREAIAYLQVAAQHAMRDGALDEATTHLEHGLHLLRSLPADETTLRTELAVQSSLATIHNARSWTNQALEDTCHRVVELARRLDDSQALHLAQWGLWGVWLTRGRMRESMAAANLMQAAVAEHCVDFTVLAAPYASSVTALAAGRIELALASARVPTDIDVGAMDQFVASAIHVSPWAGILVARHCGHYIQGHYSRAAADWEEVERIAVGLAATPVAQGFATALGLTLRYMSGSLVDQARRDPRTLDEQLRKLIAFCREEGIGMWQSFAILVQAAFDCQRGHIDGARQRVAEHIRLLDSAGIRLWFVQFLTLHARLCHLEGDSAKALSLLDEAEAEARGSGQELGVCEMLRLRAQVLAGMGKRQQAMKALSDASAAAARLGSPTFGLRCALDQHALARETGEKHVALVLLQRAFDSLPEPQADTPDIRRARAVLSGSTLPESRPHRGSGRA